MGGVRSRTHPQQGRSKAGAAEGRVPPASRCVAIRGRGGGGAGEGRNLRDRSELPHGKEDHVSVYVCI